MCNVLNCNVDHDGRIHFVLRSYLHSTVDHIACEYRQPAAGDYELFVTQKSFILKHNKHNICVGKVEDIMDVQFGGCTWIASGGLEFRGSYWIGCDGEYWSELENFVPVLMAGVELSYGTTSVSIGGVPIKDRYEYTGTIFKFLPGE